MDYQPKVSIIVAVYNIDEYVERCITSIVNQTYKNIEIIIVDDGSTDQSGQICDEFASKDNRIIVIHKENGGVASARNTGFKAASSDFVMFIDGDDYLDLDMVEYLVNIQKRTHSDICYCQVRYIGFAHRKKEESSPDIFTKISRHDAAYSALMHKKGFTMNIWDGLYSRNVVHPFIEHVVFEDLDFTIKAMLTASSVSVGSSYKYNYCYRETSLTNSSKMMKKIADLRIVAESMTKVVLDSDKSLLPALYARFLRNYVGLLSESVLLYNGVGLYELESEIKNCVRLVYREQKIKEYILLLFFSLRSKMIYRIAFQISNYVLSKL